MSKAGLEAGAASKVDQTRPPVTPGLTSECEDIVLHSLPYVIAI